MRPGRVHLGGGPLGEHTWEANLKLHIEEDTEASESHGRQMQCMIDVKIAVCSCILALTRWLSRGADGI